MTLAALITAFVVAVVPVAPTEPTLVGLGALAAVTHASPIGVILIATLGCSISDHLFYAAGRWGGTRLLGPLARGRATARVTTWLLERAERYGAAAFIGGRWLPAGGTAGAALAGTLGWRLRRFTPASLLGSLLWSCYATALGYLGSTVTGNPLAGLGISLIIAIGVGLVARLVLHRQTAGEPVPTHAEAEPPTIAPAAPVLLAA
ncbi:DedA family protein [Nocardia macrotermitis]|nr:VTT domain-containing protein [Nocardia macrotermitis]